MKRERGFVLLVVVFFTVMLFAGIATFLRRATLDAAIVRNRDYAGRAGIVAICSNDTAGHPADAPASLAEMVREQGFVFPLCHDESQAVAKAYHAACTPDFFVFDERRQLAYRGQLDDSRPGNGVPVTGKDLRAALDAVLAGAAPVSEQRASLGCNIKWKAGNEPEYFG